MKIGIYGNCQVASYKEAFRCKLPRATIVSSIDQYECADEMESCEIILLQSDYWDAQYLGKLRLDSNIKFVKIPNFYFPAFHPDLVIEHSPGGTVLLGPAGSYNSSIVIYGFLRGLSTSETIRLFDDRVFERLGFYSYEEASRVRMEQDLSSCGLDGSQIYAACRQLGCFMYSVNHPTLEAVRVVANAILNKYSLQQEVEVGESSDPLRRHGRWPVYPEIADKFGIKGDYNFCFGPPIPGTHELSPIGLEKFVEESFRMYRNLPVDAVLSRRLQGDNNYRDLERVVGRKKSVRGNVYANLPASSYWKKAIAETPIEEVDPVSIPRFTLKCSDKIATGGSCFAQHISRTLVAEGYSYYVVEPAPTGHTQEWAASRHYGVFSARYGNIYTARQLRQLISRCQNEHRSSDMAWQRPDGRFVDPFRPQIEPDGYESAADVERAAEQHLALTRKMFCSTDVFIFTLGLTECWTSKVDGIVFPIAPGIVAGKMDDDKYEFKNFRYLDVVSDLRASIIALRLLNPRIRVILTVSPVPLVATYERRHVLESTIYSKSVLRAAVQEIRNDFECVEYFPSYEIITGNYNMGRYFENDKRSVNQEGVNKVMALLAKHYFDLGVVQSSNSDSNKLEKAETSNSPASLISEMAVNSKILCDEELLTHPIHHGL